MTAETYANFTAYLAGAIDDAQLSIPLGTGAVVPSGSVEVRIDDEYLSGSISGTTLTVAARGAQSSTPAAHAAGAVVYGVSLVTTSAQTPLQLATTAATVIVEEFLRHPLAYVTGELTRVCVDENGSAELPMRPVRAVTTVLRSSDQTPVPNYRTHLHWIENVWAVDWIDVTYDHGWHDDEIPPIIGVVINALALRIVANPESTQRKRVGDLLVDFRGGGSPALTPEDEKLLSRYRSGPGAATTLTQLQPVPPGPRVFGDWW